MNFQFDIAMTTKKNFQRTTNRTRFKTLSSSPRIFIMKFNSLKIDFIIDLDVQIT